MINFNKTDIRQCQIILFQAPSCWVIDAHDHDVTLLLTSDVEFGRRLLALHDALEESLVLVGDVLDLELALDPVRHHVVFAVTGRDQLQGHNAVNVMPKSFMLGSYPQTRHAHIPTSVTYKHVRSTTSAL